MQKGKIYLVGAGPGDPSLLTIKGKQCLENADVVVYDYLASEKILSWASPTAAMYYVGKKAGCHTLKQDEINALLVKCASDGHRVVRLKGGDPFVFGRGGEECMTLLDAGIPFEIVPGITAGIAASAYAGIPVTHRHVASSVAFVTGHEDPTKENSSIAWEPLVKGVDTVVFYMGVGNLPAIVENFVRYGRSIDTPVGLVQWGTYPRQRTVTATLKTVVDKVKHEHITPPAIVIVGEVVTLHETLQWFEKKPMFGKKIINTRSRLQASSLTTLLEEKGADVYELPTIKIVPQKDPQSALGESVQHLDRFDWILFTSPNGVHAFFEMLLHSGKDIRECKGIQFGAIGPGTEKAINQYFIHVACTATVNTAEGFCDALKDSDTWKDRRVLLPRASIARDLLPSTLKKWGAIITEVEAYRTVQPEMSDKTILDMVMNSSYDCITFSSSSTVHNFVKLFTSEQWSTIQATIKAVSIGPITSETMRSYGIMPKREAQTHTIEGLAQAIEEYI